MNNPVIIKGNKFGIVLVLDKDMPFEELLIKIGEKFKESAKFFDNKVQLAISFEGRKFNNQEIDLVLNEISRNCDLHIDYVIDLEGDAEVIFQRSIEKAAVDLEVTMTEPNFSDTKPVSEEIIEEDKDSKSRLSLDEQKDGMFYKGTLRSGQSLESLSSIVVIGDVNPGASVTSNGNIVIIGALKGTAFAGANGNTNAFVMALSMSPMQIRIGDIIARCSDEPRKKENKEAKIAFVENDNIYIEPLSKSVLNDINI